MSAPSKAFFSYLLKRERPLILSGSYLTKAEAAAAAASNHTVASVREVERLLAELKLAEAAVAAAISAEEEVLAALPSAFSLMFRLARASHAHFCACVSS